MLALGRFFTQCLVTYISISLTFSPFMSYAGALLPDGSTATSVGQAGNGVPVVHIAPPSAAGLSHNKFTHYNVNKVGLILNNGTTPTINTQLGGVILANPNLSNSAKVILNEVTSTNRSILNGYTEVAGPRTDLVIANPNGLTINGAGFINTGHVTLTTGTPVIQNGALNTLNVIGGDIAIEGSGLNTQAQSSTSIYTQYLNLNAQLHANNLDVKLGGNDINDVSKASTANHAANARAVLLDSSVLGGMYANRIALLGTDAGLGVNLPPEVLASTGDIIINNNGNISLQKLSAGGNVSLSSASDITLTDSLYSGATASLSAGANFNIKAGVTAAKNALTINAAQLTNAGTILAGLNADQTQNTTGLINLTATTLINAGDIQSTGRLTSSGTNFTNHGVFNAATDLTLNSTNLTNNKTLFAGQNMNLYSTGTLNNTANANIFAMNNLTMAGDAIGGKTTSIINTQADIQALNGSLNIEALSLTNTTSAPTIGITNSVSGSTQIATDFLQSRAKEAQLLSGGNMNLNVDTILNSYSLISAAGNLNITSNLMTNQFMDLIRQASTPTLQAYSFTFACGAWNQGNCVGTATRTVNIVTNTVIGNVGSTIQTAGNITGNVTNLNSLGINANQVINATPTAFQTALPANNKLAVSLPVGTQGLFVLSSNPQSAYLIETNPKFAMFGNLISSSFLLINLNFSSNRIIKRLGDAFYENKLIRDSVFTQTGQRFLTSSIKNDHAQYQYLMDHALLVQKDLQLIPGVSLTQAQIALLKKDIVWLEEQVVAGRKVLVPVVYIANANQYNIEGGQIIAGDVIDLVVSNLKNEGLLEAGSNLTIQAANTIINQAGSIRAGNDLSLVAQNDIVNESGQIKANHISLVSQNGDIMNQRHSKEVSYGKNGDIDHQTMVGLAGNIEASNHLSLQAADTIAMSGSNLKAKNISLAANNVNIATAVKKATAYAGSGGSYIRDESTTHLASNIEGENISINASNKVLVSGSNVHAVRSLDIKADEVEIAAVNNSSFSAIRFVKKGLLSSSGTTKKQATSTNIASELSSENITLTSTKNDINITGSNVNATSSLAVDSARDINIQDGYDGSLNEAHSKKSGWFTGGSIFSKSEDLEGKLTKIAALSNVSGAAISLNAQDDLQLKGVNITADTALIGRAQNITVENAINEEKTYSKHTKLSVSGGDVLKKLSRPDKMAEYKDGKLSSTLASATYSKADSTTTKTEVVNSNLEADNINLKANSGIESEGDVSVKGSNLTASNDVNLTASGDVDVIEAKNTETVNSSEMQGKAELKVTVKNEYVQIAFALKAALESKKNLQKSKSDYSQYKRDLGMQRGKLIKLKADLAHGRMGIEQADVDEMAGLIDDLRSDDVFYKANIVLATADLATKTLAVATQMSAASAASWAYGFSASLELDIDVLQKKFNAYQEKSVGSAVTANNINITADNAALVRGSKLNANNDITINAKDTNILASQDINNSTNSNKHAHLNISYGTAGGSVTASADSGEGSSRGITHTNSQLVANNININTNESTTIAGANVSASGSLNINSNNLDIVSVQDSNHSRSNSLGFSVSGGDSGITGGGVNGGMSHSRQKQTVLTSLTGSAVNITTQANTTLRGATVAAVGKVNGYSQGNDNGNLKLKTNTLEVSSLNNTLNSKSMSMGLNVSISNSENKAAPKKTDRSISSVGIDYSNDRTNRKTKTLGTLGEGTVEVANVAASNTKMLNRDIKDNTVGIYNISSHKGLKGTVDTRLLTKQGRSEIAEELKRAKIGFYDVAKDIISEEELTILDSFSHQGNKVAFYDAMQKAVKENMNGFRDMMSDPNATRKEKRIVMQQVVDGINAQLGVMQRNQVAVISTDVKTKDGKIILGAYHKASGDIVLNEKNSGSTGETIKNLGHEMGHTVGYGEGASDVMGASLEDYANFSMWNSGDGQTLANSNNHKGTETTTAVTATTNFVERRNNDKLDYSTYMYQGIVVGTDGLNNNQVVDLNFSEASSNGFMDNYGVSVRGGNLPYIDKVKPEDLSKYKKVLNLDNKADFEALRKGTDMTYDNINKNTAIIFENGMGNTFSDAKSSQKLIQKDFNNVGLINNETSGYIGDFLEWKPNYLTTKDVLNAYVLQQLPQGAIVITHSAGNEDIYKANEVNALVGATTPYRHISVGSPKSATELKKADSSVGATFIKQVNHPNDPVANGWVNDGANYEVDYTPTKAGLIYKFPLVGDLIENHPFNNYYINGVKKEMKKALSDAK